MRIPVWNSLTKVLVEVEKFTEPFYLYLFRQITKTQHYTVTPHQNEADISPMH
jgi:hypothetical protein